MLAVPPKAEVPTDPVKDVVPRKAAIGKAGHVKKGVADQKADLKVNVDPRRVVIASQERVAKVVVLGKVNRAVPAKAEAHVKAAGLIDRVKVAVPPRDVAPMDEVPKDVDLKADVAGPCPASSRSSMPIMTAEFLTMR